MNQFELEYDIVFFDEQILFRIFGKDEKVTEEQKKRRWNGSGLKIMRPKFGNTADILVFSQRIKNS